MAKTLGNVTAKYRWFPIFYIIFMFMIVPTIFVLLSMASTVLCVIVFLLIVVGIIFIATVNWMQINKKDSLPASLQSWDSLPLWMRSLEPYDKMCCCCCASPGGSKADGAAAAAAKDPEAAVASA